VPYSARAAFSVSSPATSRTLLHVRGTTSVGQCGSKRRCRPADKVRKARSARSHRRAPARLLLLLPCVTARRAGCTRRRARCVAARWSRACERVPPLHAASLRHRDAHRPGKQRQVLDHGAAGRSSRTHLARCVRQRRGGVGLPPARSPPPIIKRGLTTLAPPFTLHDMSGGGRTSLTSPSRRHLF